MNIIKLSLLIIMITFPSFLKAEINIAHAIAMHGDPKYLDDFKYVDYVNPNAPKGGKVILSSTGSYDSFNPFILKGTAASRHW